MSADVHFLSLKPGSGATRRYLSAIAARVLSGGLRLPGGHLPPTGHEIGADFVGVGVASAADPAWDACVIEHLRELGVRQVRLDYSYGEEAAHAERFLRVLLDQGFDVLLHLVQPFDEARGMEGDGAPERWRAFVADALERWGRSLTGVEIGSTINRKRWAGYSLEGFLRAWRIAHEQARLRGVRLVGPNVTDFEPLYNTGLMAMFRQEGLLPDVHSNNMFAERAREPENFDHKVLGPRFAGVLKYNLVKKARLVHAVAAAQGVRRTWSTNAFWTLPRIARMSPNTEQKQADYLSRYFVLCAASGALARAYWGPLVCQREGLVDNGLSGYPSLERVTYYASAGEDPSLCRVRPAFHALKAFNRLIPGSRYEGPLSSGSGVEIHAFRREGAVTHVLWTRDGQGAALEGLYDAGQLARAEVLDRDGQPLDAPPELLCESPIYLRWPEGASLPSRVDAQVLDGVVLNQNEPRGRYYPIRDGRWRGVLRAENAEQARQLLAALHPDRLAQQGGELLRKGRNRVWSMDDPRAGHGRLVVKQPLSLEPHKRIRDRLRTSKARRSWNAANELLRRGLHSPRPVAFFEPADGGSAFHNWYVCERLEGADSVRRYFQAYAAGETTHQGLSKAELFPALRDFLLKLHDRGVYFRDLSGGNILVEQLDGGELRFSLIDTNRAKFQLTSRRLSQRLSDLKRVCYKLDEGSRAEFMELYLRAIGRSYGFWYRLPARYYRAKVRGKRRLKHALRQLTGRR
ncbi:lipopolysaccharide kinase InaA family protein [Alkalilimnicola sp. S0819]|uniref:lipopolysaccharide kinase InaA family protein n=1 Tax=Alkalilimnicola sp. S0819 TaxID=2613922 RepID=UPI0012616A8F|nr:lipopolysaccharide kinase InaA family protein [Alkalilimnicola sp. S0819]KAB7627674.1 hypothetical protein F3N43_04255 [Alkalilimnicola sp. S0819]MPQ15841.1 hypothetical protein [Alkalilimnicola sp. S0819]